MGARKRLRAEKLKAEKRSIAIASLRECPTSPRKMRLMADMIRGVEINRALGMLRYSKKEASVRLEKLLRSAIANWEAKNQGVSLEEIHAVAKLPDREGMLSMLLSVLQAPVRNFAYAVKAVADSKEEDAA